MSLLKIDVEKNTQLLIEVSVKIILPSLNILNPSVIEENDYG